MKMKSSETWKLKIYVYNIESPAHPWDSTCVIWPPRAAALKMLLTTLHVVKIYGKLQHFQSNITDINAFLIDISNNVSRSTQNPKAKSASRWKRGISFFLTFTAGTDSLPPLWGNLIFTLCFMGYPYLPNVFLSSLFRLWILYILYTQRWLFLPLMTVAYQCRQPILDS